ncbi:hypothetical protein [Siphonobacter sp. SORGH_AS_0500]|uniref:hypothetical protein n=1 Tax=Siphonobacter sp. SORGH_AS_0500 TaxID=1864824 RepID=UPI00285A5B2A|nr:hypothetical protein [Siphonobacter sp. SORGH_AS_0500]MDR6195169.1 putative nucleic acid-binding Zn-ribbon protein [Siphonobacter sp. SORGH_AS_0500]
MLWILLIISPFCSLFGQSISDTQSDSLSAVVDLVKNVKAIHQDLIRGDFARREVVDLRGRLQTCQVQNNALEVSIQSSQNRETGLTSELRASKAETAQVKTEKKAATRENWIWRGVVGSGLVIYVISLIR